MKKGQTPDMLFWFVTILIAVGVAIVLTLFFVNTSKTFDRPSEENPLIQNVAPLVLLMFFKLRKQR